jgi:disulfide bond formation protein DsbB
MVPAFAARPMSIALLLGTLGALLLLGALAFQYLGGLRPCELCLLQRWPLLAAVIIGLGGSGAIAAGQLPARFTVGLAVVTALAVALSGAIGVYHAGIEWGFWPGPTACTGTGLPPGTSPAELSFSIVRCDEAAWRFLGVSLAGYNALISLGAAVFALAGLRKSRVRETGLGKNGAVP